MNLESYEFSLNGIDLLICQKSITFTSVYPKRRPLSLVYPKTGT